MKKSIVLVGMPGSGKTTVSDILAKKTGLPLIDTDNIIEQKQGKTISEIFKNDGEAYFRHLESELILELDNCAIISTGGGMVQNPLNMDNLKEIGIVFYLNLTPEIIYSRIKNETHRPLLLKADPLEELKNLYNKRDEGYKRAHFIIDADDEPNKIADKVIEIYEKACG